MIFTCKSSATSAIPCGLTHVLEEKSPVETDQKLDMAFFGLWEEGKPVIFNAGGSCGAATGVSRLTVLDTKPCCAERRTLCPIPSAPSSPFPLGQRVWVCTNTPSGYLASPAFYRGRNGQERACPDIAFGEGACIGVTWKQKFCLSVEIKFQL